MTSTPQQLPHSLEAAHAAIVSAQSVIATLSEKLSQTLRENELLKLKIDKLCRRLFGKSSEKVSPDQLALAFAQLPQDAATETDSPASESVEGAEDAAGETVRARPSPTGRKAFPKHLPSQRVLVMPAD
jgi:transposase